MSRKQARRRAPGGGRKPLGDDARLELFAFRLSKGMRKKLRDLADRRGTDMSTQLRAALMSWDKRSEVRSLHTEALATAVAVLADRIEEATGKRWLDDSLTSQLVRERVEQLVAHLIPPPAEPVSVPGEIKEAADLVLTLLKAAVPRPGSPRLGGAVIIDDRGLATIMNELALNVGGIKRSADLPNVRALPELVARRDRQRRKKQ
jgi:hypothetical protein